MVEHVVPMRECVMRLRSGQDITGLTASCGCVYARIDGRCVIIRSACREHKEAFP